MVGKGENIVTQQLLKITSEIIRNLTSMKKKVNYIETISALLTQKGVGHRKHASMMATILGLQYNSAKQKLDGKRGITFDEIKKIFKYFNEPFESQKTHNCVFIMNNIHKRCNIEVDEKPVNDIDENEKYAIKNNMFFTINANCDKKNDSPMYKVNSIDFMPPPKIAILDNNHDILELLKRMVNRYGIEADTFQSKEEIINAMTNQTYDAYILDWLLDFDDTPESIVRKLREEAIYYATIIILTGQLNHYEKNISEMILNYDVHLVEKPTKPLIISSILLSNLFFS